MSLSLLSCVIVSFLSCFQSTDYKLLGSITEASSLSGCLFEWMFNIFTSLFSYMPRNPWNPFLDFVLTLTLISWFFDVDNFRFFLLLFCLCRFSLYEIFKPFLKAFWFLQVSRSNFFLFWIIFLQNKVKIKGR